MKIKEKIIVVGAICSLGVLDSFLIDPFLLTIVGALISYAVSRSADNLISRRRNTFIFNIFTLVIFWAVGVGFYFNLPALEWIWNLVGAQSGRDWMVNSGIFHFNFVEPSALVGLLSGFLFAIYPLWLILGEKIGVILFGVLKGRKGLVGLFKSK